jgi:hypothetical protein
VHFDAMMQDMPRASDTDELDTIVIISVCRSDLLARVERWTYGRKIKVCKGISAKVISVSEAILAHGLSQDEIDRWMEAYRRKDFEALKVSHARKQDPARKTGSSSWPSDTGTASSD